MTTLTVNDTIKAWIAPLLPEELAALTQSILDEGCRDPLVIWDGTILDGHHRFNICREHNKPFKTVSLDFAGMDDAEVWVRTNQAARRNLTDDQRAVNAKRLKDALARVAKRTRAQKGRAAGGKRKPDEDRLSVIVADKRSKQDNRQKAAKAHRTSERKIRLVDEIEKKAPDLISEIQAGTKSIKAAKREVAKREKAAAQETAKVVAATTPMPDRCDLRVADVRDFLASLSNVNAIITDPPYERVALPLYTALAEGAAQALAPNGLLAVMCGHQMLPEIFAAMSGHIPYLWTLAYLTPGGQSAQYWPAKVNTFWKPILLFGRAPTQWISDVVKSDVNDNDKRFHRWGQSESGMAALVERLTNVDDLVCDPFLGGGTTAVVSLNLGRRFVGADIDAALVATAHARLVEDAQRTA